MGFFKCLAYVAGGVGAVVLAPMTGGSSLALAIGAMGTTTAAGAAIGATVGAAAAAIDHAATSKDEAYERGISEGARAGERAAQQKYEQKITELTQRLKSYHDSDAKLVGMYALGLAIANADGHICDEEREELDVFVSGCMAGHLPSHIKNTITNLSANPPTIERALEFARSARLPKRDIDDIIDIVANADGYVGFDEQEFIGRWQQISQHYEYA